MHVTRPKVQFEIVGNLGVVQSFVNTLDIASGKDGLREPAQLAAWFATHGLMPVSVSDSDASTRQATGVREAIRELILANSGFAPDPSAETILRQAWKEARPMVVVDDRGAQLVPEVSGVAGNLGILLIAMYEATANGTWRRLKACRDEGCQRAFYDTSKNHSGKWCSMARCGNRAKVRRYRERRRLEDRP